ncbi:hypothetical protein Csp2054_13995 [Curtobacterium sp. 'Ferrero']|uniref:hypothetical protein n=1 Tax=Curtobacterium sp. 'Ferrero' TaxID=2033654 RepID=UPI000BDA5F74|nr:hypothetical protein [Curtobacterium sp. 'Ferrero']PCN47091.1 hypothetical protein Csp2054_13995 [Curtobacterium sp. 'Ferrero']
MFRLGWRVFRERLPTVRDARRVHRARWIALGVALLVGAVAVWRQAMSEWAGTGAVGSTVAIVLLAVAAGLAAAACCPTASEPAPAATINGRQIRPDAQMWVRKSVGPYLQRRPREVLPEHAEAVRNDVELLQRGYTRQLVRWATAVGALLCFVTTMVVVTGFPGYAIAWAALYGAMLIERIIELGRSERARRSAVAAAATATATPTASASASASASGSASASVRPPLDTGAAPTRRD